ncbi:MAG: hypothetical protein WCD70_10510 [Alphaproteobacteria bacterium]
MPKGRKPEPQKRIGKNERKKLNAVIKAIKNHKVFHDQKKEHETRFNDRLRHSLRQKNFEVINKGASVTFVGETFRPEFYVPNGSGELFCAIECKRLTEAYAKPRWKEGLSQAVIYSILYKAVILVLYDYTKDGKYKKKFGAGNKAESRFVSALRESNVYIVVIRPES